MSELDQLQFPDTVRYSKEHTWVRRDGDVVVVGISDYAQSELGEIVFIELPEIGAAYSADEVFGVVESVKAASDLYMPIGGEVTEVNESLEDEPEVVNSDPFGKGWMLKIKSADTAEIETLLNAQEYLDSMGM
ncbi:MAG: glycine cleavage system protein GcvH [Desulfobulbia bacterium]